MNAVLVNGWGIADSAAAGAFPGTAAGSLEVIPPTPGWSERVERSPAGVLVGYSTGALLLLTAPLVWGRFERVVLFAPFPDFKADADQGGRVKAVQLRVLLRNLRRDPLAALHDFYGRAALRMEPPARLPQTQEDLCWGIERLLEDSADPACMGEAECYVGASDTLLDAARLAELCPTIRVVPDAGHDLGELVREGGFTL